MKLINPKLVIHIVLMYLIQGKVFSHSLIKIWRESRMIISRIPQQTHWDKLWPNLKLPQISFEEAHKSTTKNVECYKKLVRLKPQNLLTHNYWALTAWEAAVLNNQMLLWQCERVLGEGHPSLTLLPARQAGSSCGMGDVGCGLRRDSDPSSS